MYAFADGNPISETDPFGLGAVGDSQGYSWIGTPCIQCHGVSAFGYNGNPTSFSAYVPGSAPDAMEGYQGLEDMSVGATKLAGGALVGNAMGPVVSAGLGSLAAWLGDATITTTTTVATEGVGSLTPNLANLSRGELAQMLSPDQTAALRQLFGTGPDGAAKALAAINSGGQIPAALTTQTLQVYQQIALKSVAEGIDTIGTQNARLQVITAILKSK